MEIKVYSEIGKLKKVLVHRPGKEVERLYPEVFERLLFDDIVFLEKAREEHDGFVKILKDEGVEVFYIEELVAEVVSQSSKIKEEFLQKFLDQSGIKNKNIRKAAYEFYNSIKDNYKFVRATIAGLVKREINPKFVNDIVDLHEKDSDYPFYIDPIPNILFQRDPIASIFDSINHHNMWSVTRRREAIYYEFLFKYHPEFKKMKHMVTPNMEGHMEGGDVLVINKETIFVGLSQRTTAEGIKELSENLFKNYSHLKRVVGIEIPKSHATMHLDTVLTQMDYDKFSVDNDMAKLEYKYFVIERNKTTVHIAMIEDILKKYVHPKVKIYIVGGGDPIRAKREQWNDGANCLVLEPGKIFVYDRNWVTNQLLEKAGIKLLKVSGSELGRGRGGPRCMSMPLEREDI